MPYQSFEDLEVWQRGCRLAVEVFQAFDDCKNFTIKDQIQRSALSVPSNIAEGAERGTSREFAHFINIAKGSGGELRTQLYIARKLNFISKEDSQRLVSEAREVSSMMEGLRRSLVQKSRPKEKRARKRRA